MWEPMRGSTSGFGLHVLLEKQAGPFWYNTPTMGFLLMHLGDVLIEVRETGSDELGDRLYPEDPW